MNIWPFPLPPPQEIKSSINVEDTVKCYFPDWEIIKKVQRSETEWLIGLTRGSEYKQVIVTLEF